MRAFVVTYFGADEGFDCRHLAEALTDAESGRTEFVVRRAEPESIEAEYAGLYAALADERGKHRGCGCEVAPLGTMLRSLLDDFDQLYDENGRLRRENAQLQTALSTLSDPVPSPAFEGYPRE